MPPVGQARNLLGARRAAQTVGPWDPARHANGIKWELISFWHSDAPRPGRVRPSEAVEVYRDRKGLRFSAPFNFIRNAGYDCEMSAQRSYKRPPVAEAAIELRFENPISQSDLERAAARLEKEYPISETELAQTVTVDNLAGSATFSSTWQGIKRSSVDRTDVTIFRTGTLVVGHLAPYRGWEHLFERIKNAWLALARATGENIALSRIGVRYINRVDIPENNGDDISLFNYVRFHPQAPEGLIENVPITEYYSHVVYPMPEDGFAVRLVAASALSPLVYHKSLIFDIDVFRDHDLPRKVDEVWQQLSVMRDRKNMIFEMCVTDKARELFDR